MRKTARAVRREGGAVPSLPLSRSRSQELPSLITAEAAAGLVEEVAERGANDRAAEVVQ